MEGGGGGQCSARERNDFNSASLRLLVPLLLHLQDIMNSEKSYDSLPNFTAADCEFAVVLPFPCQ